MFRRWHPLPPLTPSGCPRVPLPKARPRLLTLYFWLLASGRNLIFAVPLFRVGLSSYCAVSSRSRREVDASHVGRDHSSGAKSERASNGRHYHHAMVRQLHTAGCTGPGHGLGARPRVAKADAGNATNSATTAGAHLHWGARSGTSGLARGGRPGTRWGVRHGALCSRGRQCGSSRVRSKHHCETWSSRRWRRQLNGGQSGCTRVGCDGIPQSCSGQAVGSGREQQHALCGRRGWTRLARQWLRQYGGLAG